MWVHPPTSNWVSGNYSLLLRVTDSDGHVATRLANLSIGAGTRDPGMPPITNAPGTDVGKTVNTVSAVN